jgi:hypothetical protein
MLTRSYKVDSWHAGCVLSCSAAVAHASAAGRGAGGGRGGRGGMTGPGGVWAPMRQLLDSGAHRARKLLSEFLTGFGWWCEGGGGGPHALPPWMTPGAAAEGWHDRPRATCHQAGGMWAPMRQGGGGWCAPRQAWRAAEAATGAG